MQTADSFERVAHVAAPLFLEQGYAAVSLRAVARELGIKPASLYYHCPRGKSELYRRSLQRFLEEYRRGLSAAAGRARFPEALLRMTDWMLEHPPVDLQRIVRVDFPRIAPDDAAALLVPLHDAVLDPFERVIEKAREGGTVRADVDPALAAGSVVALVDGLGFLHLSADREPTTDELHAARRHVRAGIELLVDGLR